MEEGQRPWVLKHVSDSGAVTRLQGELNQLAEPLARALVARGISSLDEARHFFRAGIETLHDPMLLKDMAMAGGAFLYSAHIATDASGMPS